jgi:cysteine desulfurase
MKKPLYFDYMATTPTDPRVVDVMLQYLTVDTTFGNPASVNHSYGWAAAEAVNHARSQVAALINADPHEIIWTSGATEADNLAIIGAARFYQKNGRHIITSSIEHRAVLDACKHLESEGFSVTYLEPLPNGIVSAESVAEAIRPDTILISLMHANNEIGVIQPIEAVGALARSKGILFHVDAAQTLGKIPLDLNTLAVDLMSFSAHKLYGPKGIGALYVRRKPRVHLQPLLHGGGHEQGLRSGTLPTHQIMGMGKACELAGAEMPVEATRLRDLRDRLWQGISDIPGVLLNGDYERRLPGNLNISVSGVDGESLLLAVHELAVSHASACASASVKPSYVLLALGRDASLAHSALRLSFGRFTTEADITEAIRVIRAGITHLRAISL